MDKKSKILVVTVLALIIASIAFTFHRTILDKDFSVTGEAAVTAE